MVTSRFTSFAITAAVCIASLKPSVNAFTPPLRSATELAHQVNLFAIKNERNVDHAITNNKSEVTGVSSRSSFLQKVMKATTIAVAAVSSTTIASPPRPSLAAATADKNKDKQLNLSNEELAKIITSDMVDRSFLVSADLTRSIYSEDSTFQDEIDTYPIDKWVIGTQRLFVAEKSQVDLVGDVVVTPTEASFKFREDLMFRIPFRPVVTLSGKVLLTRDEETGLITKYREVWDQSVADVLKTAKF